MIAALDVHGDIEDGAILGFKGEVEKVLIRLKIEHTHVHILLIAGGGGDVKDGEGHVEAIFIERVERGDRVVFQKVQLAEVIEVAEHGAVAHIVAVDEHVLVQRIDAVALVEEGRALGRVLAEEVVGKVVLVVALDDGELDALRRVQIGDGFRIGRQKLRKGGLRLGQGLLRAGGGVVKPAHGLVGVFALPAHAVLPAKQRHAGESDQQAQHPQDEVHRSLSLDHVVPSVAARAAMFAAAPMRGGQCVSMLIRAQTCASKRCNRSGTAPARRRATPWAR